jgi:hypothetical protein
MSSKKYFILPVNVIQPCGGKFCQLDFELAKCYSNWHLLEILKFLAKYHINFFLKILTSKKDLIFGPV